MPKEHNYTGAHLLVDSLIAHKVRYIFGVPGASIMPILDVLADRGPEFIICRHEQNAVFMAQAWGRLTGQPGICLATAGPGATNLVTGVATATADRDPIIVITGQTPRAQRLFTRHQNIDSAQLFQPVSKWSAEVEDASAIAGAMATAFRTALAPRPGAVHLALPSDVLKSPMQPQVIAAATHETMGQAAEKELQHALELLGQAQRPIVLVGVGASKPSSTQAIRKFLEATDMPAVCTFEGAGIVGRKLLNQFLGRVGLAAQEPGDIALSEADLIITIGYDVVEYAPALWLKNTAIPIINIDLIPAEIDENYAPKEELIGDIAQTLIWLIEALRGRQWPMTQETKRARDLLMAEQSRGITIEDATIHPLRLMRELRNLLADDDIVISDVGSHQLWLAREFFTFEPRTLLFSMGFQTMGIALPWAIATRLAEPRRNIVACCGDGAFLMSIMELETAVRLKLPFVLLVWRDGSYNLIEIQQQQAYGRTFGTKFGNPDIVKLAESFGASGLRIDKPSEITPTLKRALAIKGPVVIDVPIDYRDNLGLIEQGGLLARLGDNR